MDTTEAVKGELPDVAVDNLRDKEIGWAAAEKSAETYLKQVRAKTPGGCGQISRCSAEGDPKEHLSSTPNGYPDSPGERTTTAIPTTLARLGSEG